MKNVRFFNLAVALLLMASFLGAAPAAAKTNPAAAGTPLGGAASSASVNHQDALYVPGEVVVGFAAGRTAKAYKTQASALANTVGAEVVDLYGNMALLSFNEDADVWALSAQLSGQSGVAYAEPNVIVSIPEEKVTVENSQVKVAPESYMIGNRDAKLTQVTRTLPNGKKQSISVDTLKAMRTIRNGQNVPTYPNDGYEWDWQWIGTDIIWPNTAASPLVCVVDTGVDGAHPDLAGKVVNGWDFINNDAIANDDFGHGTHVSGTIVANMNNGQGMAGISNGKVLAVKVLNAQGWGTDFDVSAGIRYCADAPLVKVINMSLGGSYPGDAEFTALQHAINDKHMLVVVAAGNEGAAWNTVDDIAPAFPAGWSSNYVCRNGTYNPDTCDSNNIYQALLAVGAAGSPFRDDIWVDTDGSTTKNPDRWWDGGEMYYQSECAAWFSNFGSWVQIVAPGQDVWSTTPVSYPFYEWAYGGSRTGYDSWSGTSMATPHVSAGAARAWSVYPAKTAADIKTLLLNTGDSLLTASDPNVASGEDAAIGYYGDGYSGDAPYCWPDGYYDSGDYSSWLDMSDSVYLNVAGAMGRGALVAVVDDATTGLGIANTTVTAYQGTTLRDTTKNDAKGFGDWFDMINLPATNLAPAVTSLATTYYTLKVTNANTSGVQTFATSLPVYAGSRILWMDSFVGVPPKTQIAGVLNWGWGDNLDLYTWVPMSSGGAVVGAGDSGSEFDFGPGKLQDFPRARWNRDGGPWDMGLESVSIVPKPGVPTAPYYLTSSSSEGYNFIVTDYGSGALDYGVFFRYWVGGVIKATVYGGCSEDEWWQPGVVGWGYGANFHVTNVCGDDSIQPYSLAGGLSSTGRRSK